MAKPVQAQISFLWGHPAGVRTFPKRNSGWGVESRGERLTVPSLPPQPPFNPQFPGQQLALNDGLVGIWNAGCRDAKGSVVD